MPKVLVSDKLSPTAVQIFKDNGVDVDYLPDLGKDKDKLFEVIGQYDGLAIRSATKVTEKIISAATNLKVIGRAGIGVAMLPAYVTEKEDGLIQVLPEIELPAYEAYFVYPPALKNSKRVGVFRDFLVSKAREWSF